MNIFAALSNAAVAEANATFATTAPTAAKATEAIIHKSTCSDPVAVAWGIFGSNPSARRCDAIRAAEAAGVATYTARTQYQRWFKAQKIAAAE